MKVVRIVIDVALEDEPEKGHATHFEFDGQKWLVDGPMFPRIGAALNEIVQLVKGRKA